MDPGGEKALRSRDIRHACPHETSDAEERFIGRRAAALHDCGSGRAAAGGILRRAERLCRVERLAVVLVDANRLVRAATIPLVDLQHAVLGVHAELVEHREHGAAGVVAIDAELVPAVSPLSALSAVSPLPAVPAGACRVPAAAVGSVSRVPSVPPRSAAATAAASGRERDKRSDAYDRTEERRNFHDPTIPRKRALAEPHFQGPSGVGPEMCDDL